MTGCNLQHAWCLIACLCIVNALRLVVVLLLQMQMLSLLVSRIGLVWSLQASIDWNDCTSMLSCSVAGSTALSYWQYGWYQPADLRSHALIYLSECVTWLPYVFMHY